MTDGGTNTLAARGLEELSSVVLLCQFFGFWWEIVLGVTYIPYQLCCVFFFAAGLHRSVFLLWREIGLGVTYLPTIPVMPLCHFFGCGGK